MDDKGTEGKGTGGGVREAIRMLQKSGMSLEQIGSAVNRSASTLSSILSGDIANPPKSLLTQLKKVKPPKKDNDMKMAELVLSELANDFGIVHGSADSAEYLGEKIKTHVNGLTPLALSERETSLVKDNRTAKIDMALSEGYLLKGQADLLKKRFASNDLVLSETDAVSDTAFATVMEMARMEKARIPSDERSPAQALALAEGDDDGRTGKGKSRLVTEMKSRTGAA